MRSILYLVIFFISLQLNAQGNLQFNQVISETFSISGGTYNSTYNFTNSYTVPSGKVWKIESVTFRSNSVSTTYHPSCFISINGIISLYNYGGQANQNDAGGTLNEQPIWLKAGDVVGVSMRNSCATNCSQSVSGHISILEFNVTP